MLQPFSIVFYVFSLLPVSKNSKLLYLSLQTITLIITLSISGAVIWLWSVDRLRYISFNSLLHRKSIFEIGLRQHDAHFLMNYSYSLLARFCRQVHFNEIFMQFCLCARKNRRNFMFCEILVSLKSIIQSNLQCERLKWLNANLDSFVLFALTVLEPKSFIYGDTFSVIII